MNKAERQLKYTMATQAIEKAVPSKDALYLCEKISDGKISANHAIETIKQKYGLSRGNAHVQ